MPALILFLVLLNFLYKGEWIDPRNKAYGLSYENKDGRPVYSAGSLDSLSNPVVVAQDQQNMISILESWKRKQGEEKPMLVLIATSGGGTRSATFTFNALQHLDSATKGQIMNKTFLITGASGGMIGATYFRELYREKIKKF